MSELILKDKPVGIDAVINNINNIVFKELGWTSEGDNPVNYTAYHRALKNPKNGGVIPEVYEIDTTSRTGEYTESLYDDRLDASSFFYIDDNLQAIDNGRMFTTTISMVFQVDLSVVADNIKHRGDSEIHRVVVNAINKGAYGSVSNVVMGIPNVYSEFDQSQIEFTDMHPFHCFRVDVEVAYQLACCEDGCNLHELGALMTVDGGYILLVDGGKILIN